jgi:hypothetical protein
LKHVNKRRNPPISIAITHGWMLLRAGHFQSYLINAKFNT